MLRPESALYSCARGLDSSRSVVSVPHYRNMQQLILGARLISTIKRSTEAVTYACEPQITNNVSVFSAAELICKFTIILKSNK